MKAVEELKQFLSEDLDQLESLTEILRREKELLRQSDIRALQAVTEEKNALLAGFRSRARHKIRALVAMGYRPDMGTPSRFIRASGLTEVYRLWQQADERLRACHQANQENGRIIGHLQKRLERLTDIFRGGANLPKLYGARGEQTSVGERSILASA